MTRRIYPIVTSFGYLVIQTGPQVAAPTITVAPTAEVDTNTGDTFLTIQIDSTDPSVTSHKLIIATSTVQKSTFINATPGVTTVRLNDLFPDTVPEEFNVRIVPVVNGQEGLPADYSVDSTPDASDITITLDTAPYLTGTAKVGEIMSVVPGVYDIQNGTNTTPIARTYSYEISDTGVGGWTTASITTPYTLLSGDETKYFRVTEQAIGGITTLNTTSVAFGPIAAAATHPKAPALTDQQWSIRTIDAAAPLTSPTVLTGDQGYVRYQPTTLATDLDASGATFRVDQAQEPYPINIVSASAGKTFLGGTVLGEVSQTLDWNDAYDYPGAQGSHDGNSAALRFETTSAPTITNWSFDSCWDAIRLTAGCDGAVIDHVQITRGRDDSIENDYGNSCTIRNCLFEGFTAAISCTSTDPATSGKTITFTDTLVQCLIYNQDGAPTHGSPFKVNSDGSNNPSFVMTNCIIAINKVDHAGYKTRLAKAFQRMTATNCYWLNLTDNPLPSDYPARPAGFTTVNGAQARAQWDAARAAWLTSAAGGTGYGTPQFAVLTSIGATTMRATQIPLSEQDNYFDDVTYPDDPYFPIYYDATKTGTDGLGNDLWKVTDSTWIKQNGQTFPSLRLSYQVDALAPWSDPSGTKTLLVSLNVKVLQAPSFGGSFKVGQTGTINLGTYQNSTGAATVTSLLYRTGPGAPYQTYGHTFPRTFISSELGYNFQATISAPGLLGPLVTTITSDTVLPADYVAPTVTSITLSSGTYVNGATATATAVYNLGNGTNPTVAYQWKLNGSNVGTNSTSYVISGTGSLTCTVTVTTNNGAIPTSASLQSAASTVTATPVAPTVTSVTLNTSAATVGQTITATAVINPGNGTGLTTTYQWKLNGGNVGSNQNTYLTTATGSVTCTVTASSSAGTSSPLTSSPCTVTAVPQVPIVTVALDNTGYQSGQVATGTVTLTDAGNGTGLSYSKWFELDGAIVAGPTNSSALTLTYRVVNLGTLVFKCTPSSSAGTGTTASSGSATVVLPLALTSSDWTTGYVADSDGGGGTLKVTISDTTIGEATVRWTTTAPGSTPVYDVTSLISGHTYLCVDSTPTPFDAAHRNNGESFNNVGVSYQLHATGLWSDVSDRKTQVVGSTGTTTNVWQTMPFRTIQEWNGGIDGGEGEQWPKGEIRSPVDPNFIVFSHDIGSPGWKSVDGGATWRPFFGVGAGPGKWCQGTYCSLDNADVVWSLCSVSQQLSWGNSGIYRCTNARSTDYTNPDTWTKVYDIPNSWTDGTDNDKQSQICFAQQPGTSGSNRVCYWALKNGPDNANTGALLRSTNGGVSWSSIANLAGSTYGKLCHLAHHPSKAGRLYLAAGNGLWCITNATGTPTFTKMANLAAGIVTRCWVDPTTPSAAGNNDVIRVSIEGKGVYTTSSGGSGTASFTQLYGNANAQNLSVSPVDNTTAWLTVKNQRAPIYTDDDWTTPQTNGTVTPRLGISGWQDGFNGTFQSVWRQNDILPSPTVRTSAVGVGKTNFFKTVSGTPKSWTWTGHGYTGGKQQCAPFCHTTNENIIGFGMADTCLMLTTDGCQSFTALGGTSTNAIRPIATSGFLSCRINTDGTTNTAKIVSLIGYDSTANSNGKGIAVSTNTGVSWSDAAPGVGQSFQHQTVWYGTTVIAGAYRSTQDGADGSFSAMPYKAAPLGWYLANPQYLWGINQTNSADTVYISDSLGAPGSWTLVKALTWPMIGVDGRRVFCGHPTNINQFATITAAGEFTRWNGSAFVTPANGPLAQAGGTSANFVSWLAWDPVNTNVIYAAMGETGRKQLFRSTDTGSTWTNIDFNRELYSVGGLGVHRLTGEVFVGSFKGTKVLAPPDSSLVSNAYPKSPLGSRNPNPFNRLHY